MQGLGLAAKENESVAAQFGQMLRQGGLAEPKGLDQGPTGISPRVARKHKMTSLFSFARSFNSRAASYAQSTIASISNDSEALQPGASAGRPDGVCSTDMVIFCCWLLRLKPFRQIERDSP